MDAPSSSSSSKNYQRLFSSKLEIASQILSLETRLGENISAIELTFQPKGVCLSAREANKRKNGQVLGVIQFVDRVFDEAAKEHKYSFARANFKSIIKEGFSKLRELVKSQIDQSESELLSLLNPEDEGESPINDEFIGKCGNSITREDIEQLVTDWVSPFYKKNMEKPLHLGYIDDSLSRLSNSIKNSLNELTSLLRRHDLHSTFNGHSTSTDSLKLKGLINENPHPLHHLTKGRWIRGIQKCGQKQFLIVDKEGDYSLVNRDAYLTLQYQGKLKFKSEDFRSSIVPNQKGSLFLSSSTHEKKIVCISTSRNKEIKEWKTENKPLAITWRSSREFVVSFEAGLLQIIRDKGKILKSFSPFPEEWLRVSCLCAVDSGNGLICYDRCYGKLFKVDLKSSEVGWTRTFQNNWVNMLALTPNGTRIVIGGKYRKKKLYMVSVKTGEKTGGIEGFESLSFSVESISFSDCGKFLCLSNHYEVSIISYNEGLTNCQQISKIGTRVFEFSTMYFAAVEVFWEAGYIIVGTGNGMVFSVAIR